MRLLAPLLLAALAALIGLGVRSLLAPRSAVLPAAVAGAVGGFTGLWLHDLLDLGGAVAGGLTAAAVGALAIALPVVWFGLRR